MKKVVLVAVLLLGFVFADGTRLLTDDVGNKVKVPDRPVRVASLNAMIITSALMELGVPVVGSGSIPNIKGGENYLRGAGVVFNATFSNTGMKDYGMYRRVDLEAIKKSKPDLIIGLKNHHSKIYDKLSKIAPTYLIDQMSVDVKGMKSYKKIANVVNREVEYSALRALYLDRLNSLKSKISFKTEEKTAHYMVVHKGKIIVTNSWGAIHQAIDDFGFKSLPAVLEDKSRIYISPENINSIDSDFIFVSYTSSSKETKDTPAKKLDKIVPGWKNILKSYKNENFIPIDRELYATPTFRSLHVILDDLENRWIKD